MSILRVDDSKATKGWRRHRYWLLGMLVLLSLAPAGYLFVTGRSHRVEMASRTAAAEALATSLADSLDAAQTQLLVNRVLVLASGEEKDQAVEFASRFFDRVDQRSRVLRAPHRETTTRLQVLALRDETIAALTLADPSALRLIEVIAALHLPLVDPTLGARSPTTPLPEELLAPEASLQGAPGRARRVDTLQYQRPS